MCSKFLLSSNSYRKVVLYMKNDHFLAELGSINREYRNGVVVVDGLSSFAGTLAGFSTPDEDESLKIVPYGHWHIVKDDPVGESEPSEYVTDESSDLFEFNQHNAEIDVTDRTLSIKKKITDNQGTRHIEWIARVYPLGSPEEVAYTKLLQTSS